MAYRWVQTKAQNWNWLAQIDFGPVHMPEPITAARGMECTDWLRQDHMPVPWQKLHQSMWTQRNEVGAPPSKTRGSGCWEVKCSRCPLQSIMKFNLWLDQKSPIPMTKTLCPEFTYSLSRECSHLPMSNALFLSASRLHMATATPEPDRFTKMIPRGEFFIH